ncbi:MAG: acyl carrier protein [Polyangiaceae bacterium]|jgi:acyl carrier protein
MDSDDVWSLIRALVPTFTEVDADDLGPDTELSSLGVDSLDLVELQVEFQKRLGVKLSSSVFASGQVKTIGNLVTYVEGLRTSAA